MSVDSLLVAGPVSTPPQSVDRGLSQLAGVVMAGAGMLGIVAVGVPGREWAYPTGLHLTWRYPPVVVLWTVLLLVVGCAVAIRPQRVPTPVPAVGGLFASLLAGEGFVAVRDWFNVAGATGVSMSSLADVVTIAAAASIAGLFAAGAAVYLIWPALDRGLAPRRWVLVGAGLVAIGVPAVAAVGRYGTATEAGAVLIAQSLPWAGALLAAAYATPQVCRYLTGAVVVTSVLVFASAGLYVS